MKDGVLYDRVMSMEYDREIYNGSTLLCEIMDEGTGTQADPVHVDVLGTIDGYVTAGWGRQAALGYRATAEGIGTEASGNYAHAQGYQTTASGNQSTAMGYSTTASADGATAMGNGSTASGVNSIAGGYNTQASGAVSTAIGTNTQATQQAQLATGKYNKTNNNALVMVGNGTSGSARSNALEVLLNGDVVAGNEIIDGQGNTLSVLAEALTKTASGNPVVISDCAGGKARSLITEINAIQDLHGYDKPWVGGADINLLDLKSRFPDNAKSVTSDGVTYTRVDDADGNPIGVQASNTATGYSYCDVQLTLEAGRYKSAVTGIEANKMSLNFRKGTNREYFKAANEEFTLTEQTLIFVRYTVNQGDTANNTIKCMIYKYDGTDKTFRPYSNICPISGRTAAVVTRSDGDEISEDFTIQLGQTVYGADINWDTGVMTVDDISITFDGSNDEGWSRYNQGSASAYAMQIDNTTGNSDTNVRPMTNGASGLNSSDTYGNYDCFISTSHGANWIAGRRGISTVEDWKAWLASNPIQVCYKLATPIELTLTPTEVQMLKGYNRVTIESGSIELGYIAKLT
jgi:hypothetical protein